GCACCGLTLGIEAAGAAVRYLRETQPSAGLGHLHRLRVRHSDREMHLDSATIRDLALTRPLAGDHTGQKDATLLSVLDRTVTVMGSRLLREWILRPLVTLGPIRARLEAVGALVAHLQARAGLRTALRTVQDNVRPGSSISLGAANPRELLAVKQSGTALPEIRTLLTSIRSSLPHGLN